MSSIRCPRFVCLPGFGLVACMLLGCSGDGDGDQPGAGQPDDSTPCVTLIYSTADGGATGEESCEPLPEACVGAAKPCGSNDNPECRLAMAALCQRGADKLYCSGSSLNGKLVSVEMGCRLP